MKANETILQPLLEGTKQYFVPLFQRPYSWTKKEWEVLWSDIQKLEESDDPDSHFFGSIVTMPAKSLPEGATKYLLIDGQQRLTTTFIILILLRNLAKQFDGNSDAQINEQYLFNKFLSGNDNFKMLPTQVDRASFIALLQGQPPDQTAIGQAYRYFEKRIIVSNVTKIERILKAVVRKLLMVSIVLDDNENPHLIFESLNAKGRPLSQADLIRNYVLMRVHVDDQERVYEEHWKPLQDLLGDSLTTFIRHFLMKDSVVVQESDIYFELKKKIQGLNPKEILVFMDEMRRFGSFYGRFLNPDLESHKDIRECLERLNQLSLTTCYPFLLNVYNDYDKTILSHKALIDILETVESFLVRRIVCNVPANSLNKVFPPLYAQANVYDDFLHGVQNCLASKSCPTDAEFLDRLVVAKLYGPGDKIAKTKMILVRLEKSFMHKEQPSPSELTIEHVLPQTHTEFWRRALGSEWANEHELWKDTLGNLTLTGYNSQMGNESFQVKKETFNRSNVQLNKYFASLEVWNQEAIQRRGDFLGQIALRIWPDMIKRDSGSVHRPEDVTGRIPSSVWILGQEFPVESWRDVGQKTLEALLDLDSEAFADIVNSFPKFISQNAEDFRSNRPIGNSYYMDAHLSALLCYRYCQQITEFAGLSSQDWAVRLKV